MEQKRQRNSTESVKARRKKSTLKAKDDKTMGLEKHNGASEKLGQGRWGRVC